MPICFSGNLSKEEEEGDEGRGRGGREGVYLGAVGQKARRKLGLEEKKWREERKEITEIVQKGECEKM